MDKPTTARYRKISSAFWNDEKIRTLSDDGKLTFLFVLTHPSMTSLGAMRASIGGLACELGWTPERFAEAFREAFGKGLVEASTEACLIALPNFLKHNKPESPNVVKSWERIVPELPECELKVKHLQRVKAFTEGLGKAFAEALPEAFREAFREALPESRSRSQTRSQTPTYRPPDARARERGGDPEPISEILSRAVGEVAS